MHAKSAIIVGLVLFDEQKLKNSTNESVLDSKVRQPSIRLGLAADVATESEGRVGSRVNTILVNVANVDLHTGVVLAGDDAVGRRTALELLVPRHS